MFSAWRILALASTTRARLASFKPGFEPMRTALDYLEWLRWPDGFVCPSCGHEGGWRLGDGRFMCPACSTRSSVTAGTIFDRTRTPLTIWYTACWLFATGKDGISALSLKRVLEISSYQTAGAMLHRPAVGVGTSRSGSAERDGYRWTRPTSAAPSLGWPVAALGARRC